MSDTMLLGVLRIPPDLWINSPIDVKQRHSRYLEAADRIENLEKYRYKDAIEELKSLLVDAKKNHLNLNNGEHENDEKWNCYINGIKSSIHRLEMNSSRK